MSRQADFSPGVARYRVIAQHGTGQAYQDLTRDIL